MAIDAYLRAFYVTENITVRRNGVTSTRSLGYFRDTEGGPRLDDKHFWRFAEMIEVVEDAYDRTGERDYLRIVRELCDGFTAAYTEDWAWNKFNDDIMWACIVFLRAAAQTGDTSLADCAERNFNLAWERAYDELLGGGLWWTTDNTCKNSCINGPASIAASLLEQVYPNRGYSTRAESAFDWILRRMFDPETGSVLDHVNLDGSVDKKVWSYNLGTFIGAGVLLFERTRSMPYLQSCRSAMRCAVNGLTRHYGTGVLDDEYNAASSTGDSTGFKGIFARWAGRYVRVSGDGDFDEWLRFNAETAWSNRNGSDIVWARWGRQTPEATPNSFECSSAAALMQACP